MFLAVRPEYRRRGIGTALHEELKAHIPREVAFMGGYALIDAPVIPFLEKLGYLPGKQYLWMDRREVRPPPSFTLAVRIMTSPSPSS